jgi:hypothetical protein
MKYALVSDLGRPLTDQHSTPQTISQPWLGNLAKKSSQFDIYHSESFAVQSLARLAFGSQQARFGSGHGHHCFSYCTILTGSASIAVLHAEVFIPYVLLALSVRR